MATIKELNKARDAVLEKAQALANTGTHSQCQEAMAAVVKAQNDIIAFITEGAKPCPRCGGKPIGMEQPIGKRGRVEYEVGCPACKPFEHTDGTMRKVSTRGGLLPRHAVEAWNEGPDHWTLHFEGIIPQVQKAEADE